MLHAQFQKHKVTGDYMLQNCRYHALDGNQFASPSWVTLSFVMQMLFFSTLGMRSSCEVVVFIDLKKALSGK